jgi:hypothetical protein
LRNKHTDIYHDHNPVCVYIHRKFEQEQWRRPRPPTSKQLDNLRMNGAGNGKPNLLDWFSKLVLAIFYFFYTGSYILKKMN